MVSDGHAEVRYLRRVQIVQVNALLLSRDLALEVLLREPDGSFLVRESHSRGASGLALSVRVPLDFHPGGIAHYLIVRAPKGYRIKVRCAD